MLESRQEVKKFIEKMTTWSEIELSNEERALLSKSLKKMSEILFPMDFHWCTDDDLRQIISNSLSNFVEADYLDREVLACKIPLWSKG